MFVKQLEESEIPVIKQNTHSRVVNISIDFDNSENNVIIMSFVKGYMEKGEFVDNSEREYVKGSLSDLKDILDVDLMETTLREILIKQKEEIIKEEEKFNFVTDEKGLTRKILKLE